MRNNVTGCFAMKSKMLLVMLLMSGLTACSSPTEKANSFYAKGEELLKKGDLNKAQVEFKNALQIRNSMPNAWYGLAEIAERKGEWQQMFELMNKVLELDPKNLLAQVKVGQLLLASGKLDMALDASNKALALNKDDASALTLHAAVVLKLGDAKGAVENANLALAKDPGYVDALLVLATERLNADDSIKAIEYLDQGLKLNDKNVALQLIKVQAFSKLAKQDKAEEVFLKLIKYYPENRELMAALARFYLSQGRKGDAEKVLVSIVEKNATDIHPQMDLISFLNSERGPMIARQQLENYVQKEPTNNALKFALVSLYQAQSDSKLSQSLLREIIKKEGDSKDGLAAKGLLAAEMMLHGDKKSAAGMVDEILAQDKRNEQALIVKASLEMDARKFDEAIVDLRTILRDVPNSARAFLLLAQANDESGRPELADENYEKALGAGRKQVIYAGPYAQFLLRRNQPQRAERVIEDSLETAPDNLALLKMLAQARVARGDWAAAQAVADKVKQLGDTENLSEQIRGAVFAGQKNFSESISAFKRAYAAAPTESQPVIALVRTYILAGKTKEAADFLDSVLKENPSNVDVRLMQAQLYVMNGDKSKAEADFKEAIQQAQKNPAGYQQLASFYARNKQMKDASVVVDQGLAQAPGDLSLRLTKAGILELDGDHDEAISIYEGMLKERPDTDVVANNLASLLSEFRTDKASLNRAYEIAQRFKNSDVPQFKDTLGWASYKLGKYDDAKSNIDMASQKLPGIPVFHYHLGMIYMAKSDKTKARMEFEKALQLAGNEPFEQAVEIQEILKKL